MSFKYTFNVGPSQVSEETKKDIQNAINEKILEISHRSPRFSEISEKTIRELKKFMNIPDNYRIFYTSSATEAMISVIQNVVEYHVFHFTNGSFSGKWAKISDALGKKTEKDEAEWGSQNDFLNVKIPRKTELITVTYNETSTGVACQNSDIRFLSEKYPEKLLAVDVTSAAGGVELEISKADIWLFSVQKCFGLPAGLGILILSPRAFEKSRQILEKGKNLASILNWPGMDKKMKDIYQTIMTPNVLGIYLLGEKCERWNQAGGIKIIEKEREEKRQVLKDCITSHPDLDYFVKNPASRSRTVLCGIANQSVIARLHKLCEPHQIILGKGYGKLKTTCFRIANFPAVKMPQVRNLVSVINQL